MTIETHSHVCPIVSHSVVVVKRVTKRKLTLLVSMRLKGQVTSVRDLTVGADYTHDVVLYWDKQPDIINQKVNVSHDTQSLSTVYVIQTFLEPVAFTGHRR